MTKKTLLLLGSMLLLSPTSGKADSTCQGTDCPSTSATEFGQKESAKQAGLAILDRIARAGSPGLRIWTNDGRTAYTVGDHLTFSVTSDRELYVTVLHIDSHGTVTILQSGDTPSALLGIQNRKITLPPTGAPYQIHANQPVGIETLYALGTPLPLQTQWLLTGVTEPFPVLDTGESSSLALRLENLLTQRPEFKGYAAARFDQSISLPTTGDTGPQYTAQGIVEYFTTRHRAIRRPRLDLDIKFEFGEAILTSQAKNDLSEVGKALADSRLSGQNFRLIGHTDDIGSPEANVLLSEERAAEARRYILSNFSVSEIELESLGAGESQPLVSASTDSARAMNRRVELQLLPRTLRGNEDIGRPSVAATDIADLDMTPEND